ncbi:DUF4956 domain-containing protein [Lewinella sp. IMCC34191]|uniref:DUF4956 domain-containing protein n=1 Tax=Lewinella sp. IMCC34191 TaxID=2259172 RepID=UPI000E252A51|nr:DUF4956 domain-containing protein [Lewinella sp. IMCC34191]
MFDFDLLTYDPDTPSFYGILVATLFSFFLSSLIAITYQITTVGLYRRAHFIQSIVLIGMVAALIMQAIGDSVARGLGILGALSIIRFRTAMEDPRNITFIFASLGVGIAAGVLGFTVALTGTLIFCLAAIILRFSPLSRQGNLVGDLRVRSLQPADNASVIEEQLGQYCAFHRLEQARHLDSEPPQRQLNYALRLRDDHRGEELADRLRGLHGVREVRLRLRHETGRL